MAALKTFVLLLATCAILGAVFGQISDDQATGEVPEEAIPYNKPTWTTCDVTTTPRYTCQDCSTILKCTPVGGLLISCPSPYRPHCNNGRCSYVPSDACLTSG